MLSTAKQVLLCGLVLLSLAFIVYFVFQHNMEREDETDTDHNKIYTKMIELNLAVFLATLFSTSRTSILFIVEKVLNRQVSHSTLGLINVFIKTLCIVLFDFRIIHVGQINQDTRLMILYADIASNFFGEACHYYGESKNSCCCSRRNINHHQII